MRRTVGLRLVIGLALAGVVALTAGLADARSIRYSSGFTGRKTHATWAGPGVGVIAWGVSTDFSSYTACGSSTAVLSVDSAWNSSALHNGAELGMFFSVTRSDGRHSAVGPVYKITKPLNWPGHPAFDGQFRVAVSTPAGTYLKSATVTTFMLNGGVAYPPAFNDKVRLRQYTTNKNCP